MTIADAGLLGVSYLVGAIPFGYVITRLAKGSDIRESGSGNIGATNVLRTQGKGWGILTLVLDMLKAMAAVYLCRSLSDEPWMGALGGAFAIVGHCYPVYIGFRGGKGVASGLGAFLLIAPWAALAAVGVFLLVVLASRRVSLGSIAAAIAFSASMVVIHHHWKMYSPAEVAIGAAISLLLIARHRSNIYNLVRGVEPPLWGKRV